MSETDTQLNPVPFIEATAIDAFEGPEFLISRAHLYHGSADANLPKLDIVERDDRVNNTVGQGLYFVTDPRIAGAYAQRRAKHSVFGKEPTVYAVVTDDNLKLVNLDNQAKLAEIMNGFTAYLHDRVTEDMPWFVINGIYEAITAIGDKAVLPGNVKKIGWTQSGRLTKYLQSLDYDGLKASEGGEPGTGSHVSIVIFDPEDIRITKSTAGK